MAASVYTVLIFVVRVSFLRVATPRRTNHETTGGFRCVVGTIWKGLTPEKMEKNRSSGPGEWRKITLKTMT